MGWHSVSTPAAAWQATAQPRDPARLLARGSVVAQIDSDTLSGSPVVFQTQTDAPWAQSLTCLIDRHGAITVEMHLLEEPCFRITCPSPTAARSRLLLITFAWDKYRNAARLTVEDPLAQTGTTKSLDISPPPLLAGLLDGLTSAPLQRPLDFIALSDRPEPVGPMPGLDPLTRLDTPTGPRPLSEIATGDTVQTDRGPQTVLARIDRILPRCGVFAPTRLLAPHLGLRRDILLTGQQKILIGGSAAEYELGQDHAAIPALYLETLKEDQTEIAPARYSQLLLPKPAGLHAQGGVVESLNIGRLRRDPEALERSVLADLAPALLPDHGNAPRSQTPDFAVHMLLSDRLA